jgi:hypothetical protein
VATGGQEKLDGMKSWFSIAMLLMFSIIVHAQQDVTRFLGIPVDGSKSEMIQKLKEKGFRYDPTENFLTGEFNGVDVRIYVVTTKNKVSRIGVADANYVDSRDIRIRFNLLCEQFANNPKYAFVEDYTIPEGEDISYEINVHKKRYDAIFYQLPTDTIALAEKLAPTLLSKYTKEQVVNPTEEIQSEIAEYLMEDCFKRPVWFHISDFCGEYYITMYYDNEYNRANGEDL